MSRISQDVIDPANLDDAQRPVLGVAHDRSEGFSYPSHSHLRAQILYAVEGVLQVITTNATWVVPTQQAVWIPSNIAHATSNTAAVAIRTLYLHPDAVEGLPEDCFVMNVSPLLREVIVYAVTIPHNYAPEGPDARFMWMIPDLLRRAKPEPLQLPLPEDRRLRVVTDALMKAPADDRRLTHWARRVGASERTLARHFRRETGISFNAWRRRLRLMWAITRLSEGMPVKTVSYELGYANPSAFIAMFRRELGHSPARYLREGMRGRS